MKNFLPLLCSTSLFNGLTPEELQTLLAQLGAVMRSYGKGEALVLAGEPNRRVGIVLSGELEAYRPGPQGARIPITHMEPGGVFGDVLSGSSLASPVTVMASVPCEVLLIPYERLLLSDGSPAHQQTLRNLERPISDKYFSLSRRIDLLVLKSLRAKVCAYLLSEAERAGSLPFSIPFTRIQLAGLGVLLPGQRGRGSPQPHFYLSLLPHPAGRLPELRPQRPQPRAESDAAGRPAGHLQKQLQAAGA